MPGSTPRFTSTSASVRVTGCSTWPATGGRFGLTVWGHIKASSGAWALRPFTLAEEAKVANQAAMAPTKD